MDRRGWPWRKKTSDKMVAATESASASLAGSVGNQGSEDNSKCLNYVQISKEEHTHFTELKVEVKVLNDQLNALNEKLSTAQADMLAKDNLVKQHAKVAEEAVSGWEKADAEALALKNQLESVTLLRLTAEERAAHLDGALKECMKQIRLVKEDSEQKLHDVVFAKTKQWEKIKFELDSKIAELEQELLGASAENAALSRSLQERSNMLMKISDEKCQAEEEIEVLKTNIQSCEKEISSLKYEVHIVSKELEIRNEEKNMSVRSAEVASKQHLEDVKKITKLEAECQRLRGLVRKKLPGPAALAQMKQEVENLGRDHAETRLRRSPGKSPTPNLGPAHDFAFENFQQCHKENEFLTARLLAMEEETKMLKEALSKRNSELQASRNICAKTASKLRILESHMLVLNQQRCPTKSNLEIDIEGSLSQNGSNPPSLTSMSEDGIDDQGSCSELWATALMPELSHFKREKDADKTDSVNTCHQLELMDDFLEMEKLACLPAKSNGSGASPDGITGMLNKDVAGNALVEAAKDVDSHKEQQPHVDQPRDLVYSNEEKSSRELVSEKSVASLSKLQSRIASVIEAQTKNCDLEKLLQDMKTILHDIQEEMPQQSVSCIIEDSSALDDKHCPEDMEETIDSGISVAHVSYSCVETKDSIAQNLRNAISHIHNFVTSLCKEAMQIQRISIDCRQIRQKIGEFSNSVDSVLRSETGLDDFIVALSSVLSESKEFTFRMLGNGDNEGDNNNSDCIDKVALLESKVEPGKESISGQCTAIPISASDPEILQVGQANPGVELEGIMDTCSTEEFEKLKLEKDGLQAELEKYASTLEQAKFQLLEMERQLVELKSKLAASQKSNSLAETQLKCMTESYKSLESHTQELETEINLLHAKVETLDNRLQQERCSHLDDLAKCKDLQEQLERNQKCSMCTLASENNMDMKTRHEREIAAAAEKLAECQETIILLGRQLKALHPPTELVSSPNDGFQVNEDVTDDVLVRSGSNGRGRNSFQLADHADKENIASILQRTGGESPLDGYNPLFSPFDTTDTETSPIPRSPISSKRPKHRTSISSSSPSSPNTTPEKHGRGFSRFFSKGKSGQ